MNKYFIYAGNAYPHKNLNRLMEAMILLNQNLEERITLKIVSGRDAFVKRLEKEKNEYVELLGFVPDEKLVELYQGAVAFVFPSLSEGFGLPGIEAMAAGTLVLAADIPVFREIYQDAAIYFNPYDFSAIERAMRDVLALSPKERQKRIAYAQKFVRLYSWQKMARETLKIYQEVAK